MTSALFLDTNVPVYATGRPHPLKEPCLEVLTLVASNPDAFVTDAEVLQELLHRSLALRRAEAGRAVVAEFAELMRGRVEPVYAEDVESAALLSQAYPAGSARDLLHLAIMTRLRVDRVVSADMDFDAVAGIERLNPGAVGTWGQMLP